MKGKHKHTWLQIVTQICVVMRWCGWKQILTIKHLPIGSKQSWKHYGWSCSAGHYALTFCIILGHLRCQSKWECLKVLLMRIGCRECERLWTMTTRGQCIIHDTHLHRQCDNYTLPAYEYTRHNTEAVLTDGQMRTVSRICDQWSDLVCDTNTNNYLELRVLIFPTPFTNNNTNID